MKKTLMSKSIGTSLILFSLVTAGASGRGQQASADRVAPAVALVEVNPPALTAEVGQELKFTAVGKDESGKTIDEKPSAWFAAPNDLAAADESSTVTLFGPGEVRVGAVVGGKTGYARIEVKPQPVTRIEVSPLTTLLVVGGTAKLSATARTAKGISREGVALAWISENPSIATVDAAGRRERSGSGQSHAAR